MGGSTSLRTMRTTVLRELKTLWRNRWDTGLTSYRKAYASFGGLLLYLEGPYKRLRNLKIDNVYMLIKKA